MAKEFEWAGKLNSMARQAMAQRVIFAIQRFSLIAKPRSQGKRDIRNS
jgi:putative transposase